MRLIVYKREDGGNVDCESVIVMMGYWCEMGGIRRGGGGFGGDWVGKGGAGVQDIVWGEGLSGEDANVCFSSGAGCDQ